MSQQEHWLRSEKQAYVRVIPSVYRFLAFAIATAQIFLFPPIYQSIIPPFAMVTGVGIYTVFKALHPLHWHQQGILGYSLLGVDIALCIFLVMVTGGLYSPFLLYTLAPVLTAALLLNSKVTFSVGALSGAYVIVSQIANPFVAAGLSLPGLSYFLLYVMAVWLAAALPYLTNVNLRQRLQSQDILRERQRLSHEIHDGIAQTTSALHWQAQLLQRRLAERGIDLGGAEELVRLTEKAQQDSRVSLELLRDYTGNGGLFPCLKDYLKHLNQDTDINFSLEMGVDEPHLGALVELELLRICQEAVTNIKTHSRAHNVQVSVKSVSNHLEVSIADDGCGFDAQAYYNNGMQAKGHGLAVMRERAESIGGRFRVLSMPGQGTEVRVEVPTNSGWSRLPWLKRVLSIPRQDTEVRVEVPTNSRRSGSPWLK